MKVDITKTFDPFLFRILGELHGITPDSQVLPTTTAESADSQTNFHENSDKNNDC